jgi:hypothetical protein
VDGVLDGHGRKALEVELAAKCSLPLSFEPGEVSAQALDPIAGGKDLIGRELLVD